VQVCRNAAHKTTPTKTLASKNHSFTATKTGLVSSWVYLYDSGPALVNVTYDERPDLAQQIATQLSEVHLLVKAVDNIFCTLMRLNPADPLGGDYFAVPWITNSLQ
jgi:hypothetical protein